MPTFSFDKDVLTADINSRQWQEYDAVDFLGVVSYYEQEYVDAYTEKYGVEPSHDAIQRATDLAVDWLLDEQEVQLRNTAKSIKATEEVKGEGTAARPYVVTLDYTYNPFDNTDVIRALEEVLDGEIDFYSTGGYLSLLVNMTDEDGNIISVDDILLSYDYETRELVVNFRDNTFRPAFTETFTVENFDDLVESVHSVVRAIDAAYENGAFDRIIKSVKTGAPPKHVVTDLFGIEFSEGLDDYNRRAFDWMVDGYDLDTEYSESEIEDIVDAHAEVSLDVLEEGYSEALHKAIEDGMITTLEDYPQVFDRNAPDIKRATETEKQLAKEYLVNYFNVMGILK